MSIQDTLPAGFNAAAHAQRFNAAEHLQAHGAMGIPSEIETLTFDANGNLVANVTLRSGLYSSLIALAGSAGELGVCTDVEAIIKFNGTAGQAKAFYRPRQSTYCQLGLSSTAVPNGVGVTRVPFSTADRQGDAFTVTGGYGSMPTTLPENIWIRGVMNLAYVVSVTSLTLAVYAEDAVGAGTYSVTGASITVPVYMVAGVGAVVPFALYVKPATDFADTTAAIRWYIGATHNGSASCTITSQSARAIAYEIFTA